MGSLTLLTYPNSVKENKHLDNLVREELLTIIREWLDDNRIELADEDRAVESLVNEIDEILVSPDFDPDYDDEPW